jgi:hypothetical protein
MMIAKNDIFEGMSEKQNMKILDGMQSNPTVSSLRHALRDAQLEVEDGG